MTHASIKSMPLYATIDRIHREVAELHREGALAPEALYPFDQFHYHGTEAVAHAAREAGLRHGDRVLDVGAGIGGPARYLAHVVGCEVHALELQDELHAIGEQLTSRCGLSSRVQHLRGDALTYPLPEASFDAAVSWLAIHHIPERPRLFRRLAAALRPGGRLYIEDLYARQPFQAADVADVEHALYGVTMTSAAEYEEDVRAAGFTNVRLTDMTDDWGAFCAMRATSWRAARARHVRVHGEETFHALDRFFTTVARLFQNGSLGGLRINGVRAGVSDPTLNSAVSSETDEHLHS